VLATVVVLAKETKGVLTLSQSTRSMKHSYSYKEAREDFIERRLMKV